MKTFRSAMLWLTLLTFLLKTSPTSAHRPATAAEGVTEIPNITTSFAYYQKLTTADQIDQFSFTAQAGEFFHAGINIPAISGLENYGVILALIGPGLPELPAGTLPDYEDDNHHHDTQVAEHAHVATGLVVPSVSSEDFYEPFTQTNYWGRQTLELDLPSSGEYTLLIWNPVGQTGKYVLDTGVEEVFGPTDLFRFPIWWIDVHAFFGHTPYMLAAGLGLAVLVILGLKQKYGRQPNLKHFANQST